MRLLLLLLILANTLYFAWSQRWLEGMGFAPQDQSEPQRLAQQIEPSALRILTPTELKRLQDKASADSSPKECLQAGPFDLAQSVALRAILESSLPVGSWALSGTNVPARWIVYMGKFANADALERKRAEILALKLRPEGLGNAALEPGLSLGGFESKPAADAYLAQLGARGIHTARVVQEREEGQVYQLKLPTVSEPLKARLGDIKAALGGKVLKACG